MAIDRTTLRKRVLIGLAAVYWTAAIGVAFLMAHLEQTHILAVMRPGFEAGDPRTHRMASAAAEQAEEAEMVTLICAAALFLTIILIWRVMIRLRTDKADRTAARRAARRAMFDEPPSLEPGE